MISPEIIAFGLLAALGVVFIAVITATIVFWISGHPIHVMDDLTFDILHHRIKDAEHRLAAFSGWQAFQNGTEVIGYLNPKYTWIMEKANRQNKRDWEAYYASIGAKAEPDQTAPAPPAPLTPEEELAKWRKEHIG